MVYMVELLFRGGGEAYPSSKSKSSGIIARTNHFQTVLARRRRQFQYISRDYKHSLIGDSSILHYLTTLALSEQPIIEGGWSIATDNPHYPLEADVYSIGPPPELPRLRFRNLDRDERKKEKR